MLKNFFMTTIANCCCHNLISFKLLILAFDELFLIYYVLIIRFLFCVYLLYLLAEFIIP